MEINTNINNQINLSCPYRLPCGYCQELGRDCPKMYNDFTFGTVQCSDDYKITNTTTSASTEGE